MLWLLMESIIILFLFISLYNIISNSLIRVMQYFVLQTFSSFFILFVILAGFTDTIFNFALVFLFWLSIFLKLGLFPFFWWYYEFLSLIDLWCFFLVVGPQKPPVIYIFYSLFDSTIGATRGLYEGIILLWVSIGFLLASLASFSSQDIRRLLLWSSLGSSSWLLTSALVSPLVFLFYFFLNLLFIFLLIRSVYFYTGLGKSHPTTPRSYNIITQSLCILTLSGFPPFPIFFTKLYIIYYLNVWGLGRFLFLVLFGLIIGSFLYLFIYLKQLFSIINIVCRI